jgi:predicted nucleic acid-binding protein
VSSAQPVAVDVNVLVAAVAGGNDAFYSWPSPPPVRGNHAANVIGILNDAREFALYLSPHILVNTVRVLAGEPPEGFGWSVGQAQRYVEVLGAISAASGGDVVDPRVTVADCPDHEDNRILECALAAAAVLIVSDDDHLLRLSPWRGTAIVTSKAFVARVDAARRARRRR